MTEPLKRRHFTARATFSFASEFSACLGLFMRVDPEATKRDAERRGGERISIDGSWGGGVRGIGAFGVAAC
jgi:hypothetical protein